MDFEWKDPDIRILKEVSEVTYDASGNMISQTDANGHTTSFEYDRLGRRTKRTLPLEMSETPTYDANSRLTRKSFPMALMITSPTQPTGSERLSLTAGALLRMNMILMTGCGGYSVLYPLPVNMRRCFRMTSGKRRKTAQAGGFSGELICVHQRSSAVFIFGVP